MKKLFGNNSGKLHKIIRGITSPKSIVSFAAVLAVATLGAWCYYNTTNQDRIFWGMVDNNLQTTTFSKHNLTKTGGQSAEQVTDVFTSPKQGVFSQTKYIQTGVDEASAVTENLGTPYMDYVRYTNITTTQKNAQGKPYDFSKIVNVWGVSEPQDPKQTTGQLFNQSVLGVLPTGNLTSAQRKQLIKTMRDSKAYSYTMSKPTFDLPSPRPKYTFTVIVTPEAYITVLKEFAKQIGLNQLETIDPAEYKNSPKMQFTVVVDGLSHQVVEVTQAAGGKVESISGHNVRKLRPAIPSETISIDELQTRLQSVE